MPDAPLVTESHAALLVAVHAQPVGEVTLTVPLPPAAVNDCEVGAMLNVQANASCVTVKVCPAIVSVPVRGVVFGFAAAE